MLTPKQYILFRKIRHELITLYKTNTLYLPSKSHNIAHILIKNKYVTPYFKTFVRDYTLSSKGAKFAKAYLKNKHAKPVRELKQTIKKQSKSLHNNK